MWVTGTDRDPKATPVPVGDRDPSATKATPAAAVVPTKALSIPGSAHLLTGLELRLMPTPNIPPKAEELSVQLISALKVPPKAD